MTPGAPKLHRQQCSICTWTDTHFLGGDGVLFAYVSQIPVDIIQKTLIPRHLGRLLLHKKRRQAQTSKQVLSIFLFLARRVNSGEWGRRCRQYSTLHIVTKEGTTLTNRANEAMPQLLCCVPCSKPVTPPPRKKTKKSCTKRTAPCLGSTSDVYICVHPEATTFVHSRLRSAERTAVRLPCWAS